VCRAMMAGMDPTPDNELIRDPDTGVVREPPPPPCPDGHPPDQVTIGWLPCGQHRGHRYYRCDHRAHTDEQDARRWSFRPPREPGCAEPPRNTADAGFSGRVTPPAAP
jgi:hypothetical protein